MRILHLPVDLGGHPVGLARAQRALGHEVVVGNLAWSPFGFHGDVNHALPYGHPLRLPRREWGRLALFARSILWADVIHAHFGQTLASIRPFPMRMADRTGVVEKATVAMAEALWLKDVWLWRRLGKRVAMTFYGDDIRPVAGADLLNPWTHLAIPEISDPLAARDSFKRRLAAELSAAGVTLFAVNPDLMNTLPPEAAFLPYSHIDVGSIPFRQPEEGVVRFLHMPSNRLVKGTGYFVAAVQQLEAEGEPCSLTVVEQQDHQAAVGALASHDVLLDQLHVGWYGGVAVEAMAAGLPVVASLLEHDRAHLPAEMAHELPVISADPSTLLDTLRRIVRMPLAERQNLAVRGRRFTERWHDPASVARQVIAAYR